MCGLPTEYAPPLMWLNSKVYQAHFVSQQGCTDPWVLFQTGYFDFKIVARIDQWAFMSIFCRYLDIDIYRLKQERKLVCVIFTWLR